jgi:two-component system, sensor histidine kinase ChiS
MEAIASSPRGTLLLVGDIEGRPELASRLLMGGYALTVARGLDEARRLAVGERPQAVLVVDDHPSHTPPETLVRALRDQAELATLPLVAITHDPAGRGHALRQAGADDVVSEAAGDEILARTAAALALNRLAERDLAARARFEALVRIGQLATTTLDRETILRRAVEDVAHVVGASRCSVVLVAPETRQALVVASLECPDGISLAIDLDRYPELGRALTTGETVLVQDAADDPLMATVRGLLMPIGVRSVLVQPLISDSDVLGVLFLRVSRQDRGFVPEDVAFVRAAASALTGALRYARLQGTLESRKDELDRLYALRFQELSEANADLRTRVRASEDALSVCAHDLRGSLMALLSRASLLLAREALTDYGRASLAVIQRQGHRMADLIASLLDGEKAQAELLYLSVAPFDLAAASREVVVELEVLAASRGVTLEIVGAETIEVIADEIRIRQVLHNLVANAISYTPRDGRVSVEVSEGGPDGERARIVVSDDGPGIPESERPKIFARHRSGPGGIGLGLSICRDIVERHGGDIWFHGREGGGTAFCFSLPRATGPENDALPKDGTGLPILLLAGVDAALDARIRRIVRDQCRLERVTTASELMSRGRALGPAAILLGQADGPAMALDLLQAAARCEDLRDVPALRIGAPDDPASAEETAAEALALATRRDRLEGMTRALRRAGVDTETALLDRRGLEERLTQELERVRRYGRSMSLVLFVPQDPVPEEAIAAGAAALETKTRGGDFLAHLGGGRFAAVLVETSAERAAPFVARVAPALAAALGTVVRTGVYGQTQPDEDAAMLVARAMQACTPEARPTATRDES